MENDSYAPIDISAYELEEEMAMEENLESKHSGSIRPENIAHMEAKFQKACKQLILLNNWIRAMNVRYQRSVKAEQRAWRCMLRLRLCTVEGLRNMFHEYATNLADRLDNLEDEMGMTTDELIEVYDV